MTDHLKSENKALVERVLGYGTARTYNRHEIDRMLDAARDEGRRAVVGGDWVLVPRAADADMEAAAYAGVKPYHDFGDTYWRTHMPKDLFRLAWNFMLAAAPSPPVADKVGEQDKGSSQGSGQRGCGSRDEPAVGATAALAKGATDV